MWFYLYSDLDTFPKWIVKWSEEKQRVEPGVWNIFVLKGNFTCVFGIRHVIHTSYIQCIFQWEYIVNWKQLLPFDTKRCKWTGDLLFSLYIQLNNLNSMWGFFSFSSGVLTGTEKLSVLLLIKIVRDRNSWCSLNAKSFMCWLRKTDL